ncbi:unnamed protein product [Penicillium salamii]|uniref:Dienelactone hydrolase domain-containing protein n=1 Tax=Penicillium salamii TaxID=1612424 RepID=A0A9W4J1B0_9EURO|nr:unnamed protein product [Penicillium salamii]
MGKTPLQISYSRTVGTIHEGQPEGNISKIGNIPTYFAHPKSKLTDNAILLLTDVMGHQFMNAQLLADRFAARGYFVVMPDLFNGDVVPINRPEGFNIMDWVQNHMPPQIEPIIDAVLKKMRESLYCERIGGVGYCFGGKYVCRYLKAGKLDVGFIAHPTMLEAEDLRGIEGPLSIAAAGVST